MAKATSDKNEIAEQKFRNSRKLSMIVGDANGLPDARCIQRLGKMIPKQLEIGGEIPEDVHAFISQYKLEKVILEVGSATDLETESTDG